MDYSSLGRKAKMRHPGKYARFSDEEVGRVLAGKGFTEASFTSSSSLAYRSASNVSIQSSALDPRKEQELIRTLDDIYKDMQRKATDYSNDTGWFKGRKAKQAAESAEMYRQRANELGAMLEVGRQVHEVKLQAESYQSRILQERLFQVQLAAQARLTQAATALGMSIPTYEVYLLKKIEIDGDILRIRVQADVDLERARELSRIEIQHEAERARIELDSERERADIAAEAEERLQQIRLDVQERENQINADKQDREADAEIIWGRRVTILKDHETIAVLTDLIIQLKKDIEEIKKSPILTSSEKIEISLKKETIVSYREQKRALEQGLPKTANGQKPKGTRQAKARNPRDAR